MKKHKSLFERIQNEDRQLFKNQLQQDREEIEAEIEKHEQFINVHKALRTLPNKYQEVISLRYFEGKNNKEIVEILNINEGTLKSLISRGIKKLREKCNQI